MMICRSSQDSEGLPRLPDAAVLSILQHMPLQQRLRCALVCRSWAAAADLVPARVVASYCDCWTRSSAYTSHVPLREQFEAEVVDADAGELQDWLSSNSAKVSFVCLNPGCSGEAVWDGPDYYQDLRLDCRAVPQLTSLILWGVDLILEAAMCSSNNTADDSAGSGLAGCNITVTSSSNVTGSNSHSTTVTAAVLPALQQLILANCLIDTHSLKVLQKATALTSLKIAEFWGPAGGNTGSGSLYIPVVEDNQANTEMRKATRAELSTALVSLLQHLPLLQHLSLNISWTRDEEYINPRDDTPTILDVSPALSTLQDLQHLSLSYIPSNLEGLPTSLTKLHLHGERECLAGYQLSLQTVPQLTGLTALEHLELEKYAVDPTILPWFTHLQHLVLDDAVLLVPGPDGVLQQRHDGTPVVALLEALRHLAQLQKLILEINLDQEGIGTAAQQAERLAALTASSQLTRMGINKASGMGNWWRSIILPDQGLLHLLREGRQLPHLKELHIASAGASWLDLEGAERLVKCCPALEQLDLTALADCGTPFCAVAKALLPLRATLTSLYLQHCSGRGDATAAAAVAQLTGLQSLVLGGEDDGSYIKDFQPEFTVASVEQLTALQGLTFLCLSGQLRIYKEGGSPDVWRQLQQHCQLLDPSWIMPLVCQCRMGLPRSSSPQDRDLPELPGIAVLSIMHHMPLQQRLRCTLVCHSWAKAAKLIPSRVTVSCYECQKLSFKVDALCEQFEEEAIDTATRLFTPGAVLQRGPNHERMQQLQAWLDNTSNSNRVSQLCLNPNCFKSCGCSNAQYEDLMLSCHAVPWLTSLKLWGMRLYFAAPLRSSSANDNSAGGSLTESPSNNINTGGSSPWYDTSIALLPALQELSLSRCVMEMSNIQLLQQATALTSLTIAEIWGQRGQQINLWTWVIQDGQEDTRAATRAELVKTLVSLMQHLPLLQHLSLDISWGDDLEHLYPRDDTPTSLDLSPGLSTLQHLQQLCLPIIASIPSNFAALPASLTALHLEGVDPLFDPDPVDEYCLSLQTVPQLTGFAALQKLELKWFAVDPTSLPCFTQLRHLSLEHCTTKFMLWPDHHDVFWGGSYSTPLAAALCHLTHLQSLILDTDLAENSVGTAAEWEELLPALTASSQLTKLVLYRRSTPGDSWKESEHLPKQALQHMLPDGRQLPQLKELRLAAVGGSWLSAEQINRLVECCPALECLSLEADKNARFVAAVHALLPLRATLTSLCLGDCSVVTILWLVTAVVQLTGLRSLVLTGPDEAFPVRSIEQLTELKGLTKLSVASHLCLHNEGDSPDVWQQLQQLCQESPLRLLKLLDGPTSASKLPQETV